MDFYMIFVNVYFCYNMCLSVCAQIAHILRVKM